jgi:signal peptidase II
MGGRAQGGGIDGLMPSRAFPWPNPLTRLGLAVAALVFVFDQALKLWVLLIFELGSKGLVRVAPGLDLVLTWNRGISYGLFQQHSEVGRWILFGIMILAVIALTVWLTRTHTRLTALALGLIIGGALGNAIDRLLYGAVADFVLLYVATADWRFDWYVFNLADAAIVAGVIGLLYESLFPGRAAKAP